ncbi:hypothetical protein EJB05_34044, partial [Eragrostis curvula]
MCIAYAPPANDFVAIYLEFFLLIDLFIMLAMQVKIQLEEDMSTLQIQASINVGPKESSVSTYTLMNLIIS